MKEQAPFFCEWLLKKMYSVKNLFELFLNSRKGLLNVKTHSIAGIRGKASLIDNAKECLYKFIIWYLIELKILELIGIKQRSETSSFTLKTILFCYENWIKFCWIKPFSKFKINLCKWSQKLKKSSNIIFQSLLIGNL